MGGPLTVVVLVAAGGTAEPTTLAIERAASEALGRAARVVVREAAGAPTDGEALAIGSEANEGAVVEVTWSDRAHRVATLRVHFAGRRRWMDRTIGFGAADADTERGRTIGLALASMLPDPSPRSAPPETPAPPVLIAQPAPRARPAPIVPEPEPEPESPSPGATPSGSRYALDFFGLGAAGLGASLQTGGGGAALETFLTPRFSVRIGGAVRAGGVPDVRARTLALRGIAGIELHPWPTTASRAFGVSLRADYVLMNQAVTHRSADGVDLATMARPLSGVDAMIGAEWRLGTTVDLTASAGLEEMLATTYVDMNGARAATLPPLSAVAEGGVRLRF